jgi:hypothetical protein
LRVNQFSRLTHAAAEPLQILPFAAAAAGGSSTGSSSPPDAGLAAVAAAWADLPEAMRRAVLALVGAAEQGRAA